MNNYIGFACILTFSLFSFLFTITDVICWSIKIKIVVNSAGTAATNINHHGLLLLIGFINQPRPGLVGCDAKYITIYNCHYVLNTTHADKKKSLMTPPPPKKKEEEEKSFSI